MEFEDILVNDGGAWRVTTNDLVIPYSGIYYLHVNVGARWNWRVNFNIVYNDEGSRADVLRSSTNHREDTLGRGILAQFEVGDYIRITVPWGHGIYSDGDRQTSFTGMLIYTL